MNNEVFFDILSELDDDIISDAALINSEPVKQKGSLKSFLLIAAAVMIFIISGFILSDSIKTGNIGLYETTLPPVTGETVISEATTVLEPSEITPEPSSQEATTVYIPFIQETTEKPPVTEEPVTREPSAEETTAETTSAPTPGTDIPDSTEENSSQPSTDEPLSDTVVTSPWIDPPAGEPPPVGLEPFFIEVPAISFSENLPEDPFDTEKYTDAQSVPWHILQKIYATKIIPDYIPKKSSSGPSLDSIPQEEIKDREHTVYYTEDKKEAYSVQEFVFDTDGGSTLSVKVSTEEFPLYGTEEKNMGSKSIINDTPVLLLSGKLLTETWVLNAYFEKDGVYFRVTQKGINLNEEEFIKILKSLI